MLGHDYDITLQEGKDNMVVNALSRKHEEGSLFSLSLLVLDWISKAD